MDLLAILHWASLESRRINSKLLLMYKFSNGHAAPNLGNEFNFNYETECPYNLRNSGTDLALSRQNKDFSKRCFNYSAAVLWNKLP